MEPIKVMVNGLPGKMATVIADNACTRDNQFGVVQYSLTGSEIEQEGLHLINGLEIKLLNPRKRSELETGKLDMDEGFSNFIAIDFTHPDAVNDNAEFYCRNRIPFVMGTTGGDRERLIRTVEGSEISAVIAPNMAKQIVGFQAMMAYAAEKFPGLFSGFELLIRESHQENKVDTSGTAKAMVGCFNQLGIDITQDDIVKIRDPEVQREELGVPGIFLGGHGWHTYTLISEDDTAMFEFTHNVNGRKMYDEGAFDAVEFLHKKMQAGEVGRTFSMIDVLKG